MKKLAVWTLLTFIVGIHIVGCTPEQRGWFADPNSEFNQTGDQLADNTEGVAAVVGLLGPWGEVAAGVVTLAGLGWGAWEKGRRKLDGLASDGKYDTLKKTTAATVVAIETLSNESVATDDGEEATIGSLVKAKVKAELEGHKIYDDGKAIIAAIKEGLAEAKG